ncbi:GNAT family N-acetyltransferase [Streptomyces sp. NPDC020965]|uniref:GNAT family N-acetyltransferase n=1 Tax=Streptomyces sp. NPDC020965 TaxID=3365105 RepID=UPI0037B1E921
MPCTVRPLDPLVDAELVHGWVTRPEAAFWMMRDARLQDIEREYMAVAAHEHRHAFIGLLGGEPAFLLERYDPRHLELVGLYAPEPGDVGMRFLVAPTDAPAHDFSRTVITAVMAELFADDSVRRVVVEPDVRDDAALTLHDHVGFEIVDRIEKPEKDAYLSFCTRESFAGLGARPGATP